MVVWPRGPAFASGVGTWAQLQNALASTQWGGHQVQKPWLKQSQPHTQSWSKGGDSWQFQGKGKGDDSWGKGKGKGAPWQGKGKGAPWQGKGKGAAWQAPPWHHGQYQRKPPQSVPANFKVDASGRYTGTVQFYQKWKGFGFIEVHQPGVVPGDKLFVHWKQIQSDDRFPFLAKDLELEFGVMTWRDHNFGTMTLRARNVTMPGGLNVAMQDDVDSQQKEFVGGQHLRYTGNLKFFSPKHGFGYVIMDQGYDVDASVPNELRVETEEVNAAGQQPGRMENLAVEFGIWKNRRGQYKIYNMTLPGGHPLTQDALENRITQGPTSFKGEVVIWNWRNGWGFIRPGPLEVMPARVLAKLAEQNAAAQQRGKKVSQDTMLYFRRTDMAPGLNMRQNLEVSFQVYIDDKGAGASEVHA